MRPQRWNGSLTFGVCEWVPALIMGGSALASSLIGSHQASKATQAETDAADKSLALQQQEYTQTRDDLAPYRAAGVPALSALSNIFGVAPSATASAPPALTDAQRAQQVYPQVRDALQGTIGGWLQKQSQPSSPLSSGVSSTLASMGGATMPIQAPDGQIYNVPAAHVAEALAQGGKRVS